jgi:hypothetical protein
VERVRAVQAFYRQPSVRARMGEFVGPPGAGAVYLATEAAAGLPDPGTLPPEGLEFCLEGGWGISRSLWDRSSLLAHLDLEYVNFDFPQEPYLDPARALGLQRSVARSLQEMLEGAGIRPLHLLSGRGHHFVWRVPRASAAFHQLADLGRCARPLLAQLCPQVDEERPEQLAAAHWGLGMVMEGLAHRLLEVAAPDCPVPLQVTAVEVGPGEHGREIVSLDLSEYGDPLFARRTRVPFSVYLKPQQQPWALGPLAWRLATIYAIPVPTEVDEEQALQIMRDPAEAAGLAARVSAQIPAQDQGTCRLVEQYAVSSLARFHRCYYEEEPHPPEAWPDTYDRLDTSALPLCLGLALDEPNDLLLRPAVLQTAVRVLCSQGWHPRHVAGLVHSRYQRDHGWDPEWHPSWRALRADFYCRLFAGLVWAGLDGLVDFNCRSHQEKGYCPAGGCPFNLARCRESLQARRRHGELAGGPVHGMLPPYAAG